MQKKQISYLTILVLLLLTSACTPLYKTCLFGGCYGPFELIIKTEKGEHVEDIIVELSVATADNFEGGTINYSEYTLGNTDETLHFPRGFLSQYGNRSDVHIAVYHPDYGDGAVRNATNKTGIVDLGTVIIFNKQDSRDKSIAREIDYLRKSGMNEAEIDKKLEGKRIVTSGDRIASGMSYFPKAVAIGRDDIFDKYFPDMLRAMIKDEQPNETYDELYKIYHDAIWEKAERK